MLCIEELSGLNCNLMNDKFIIISIYNAFNDSNKLIMA